MTRSKIVLSFLSSALVLGFVLVTQDGYGQLKPVPKPTPVPVLLPSFDCSVVVSGNSGMVTIKKTNSAPVAKDSGVVATVKTPTGNVGVVGCGSGLQTTDTMKVSFNAPTSNDPNWIYTCSAVVAGRCPVDH